ncbi:Heptaprenyl diphosphate synthase component 2 [Rubripirellula tenax]|uniref:Heptaprenyl diphosphate synthase component 2 n=1 Tax=Rubripirellula tenax TaxID=2528015 RepID=A0A5C6EFR5_9BACT|nr:polyprenyl synthetase family protein [Rubripirellula tenax]TWU47314.1 Heptaprenyl diphosphate synthase component 2 [Rubripirellula tenax]
MKMDLTSARQSDLPVPTAPTESRPTAARPLPNKIGSTRDFFRRLYGPIELPLAAVEDRIASELQSPYEAVGEVLRHGTQLGGKRLRPALVLLSGSAVGDMNDDHIVLGTVIEMVHTATLIHDDVLDDAETRRHVATVNAKWNNHTSILLGDYLFAQSYRLAATLSSTTACRWIGEAARLVCEGELRQVLGREKLDIDEASYFDMIRGKTAELCRVACELGAHHSGGSAEQVAAMGRYGNAVGIAFQIADDYLDLWGDDETVGKTLGTDIEQGKITLPLIRLLATANPSDRGRIERILRGPAKDRVELIRPFLQASDAREYTQSVAERFRGDAISELDFLEKSQSKASLLAIADFSVDRRF